MKYLLFVALALTAVSSKGLLLKQEHLDEIEFVDNVFYSLYNGFVRGLYREHTHEIIDKQCFGEWIQTDLIHLDTVMGKLVNL
jgi:hypothetical protein